MQDEEKEASNFDPPTKRALEILSRIRPKMERKKDVLKQLDLVIELVKNTGRSTNPMSRIGPELDDDFKQFLMNTGFGDTSTFKKNRKSFKNRSRKNTDEDRKKSFSVVGTSSNTTSVMRNLIISEREDLEAKINLLATKVFNLNSFGAVEKMLMEAVEFKWDFDVFKFCDLTNNHPVVFMGYFLLKQRGLIGKHGLRDQNVLKFFDEVEISYCENPYHSNIHACDVMYTTAIFLNTMSLKPHVTDKEYFSTVVACSIHDIEHPGVSNIFLIRSKDHLALLYSDQSVLEHHHCYQGFNIALIPEQNIFIGFSEEDYYDVRRLIIDLVLATDMSKHFEFLNKFKNMNAINPFLGDELSNDDNRRFLIIMALKCADLSNPAKPFSIYMEWCSRIMEEFFCQGDLEKTLKLPVSKFMDRENSDIAKCQMSFIDVIVRPIYEEFISCIDNKKDSEILKILAGNRSHWGERSQSTKEPLRNSMPEIRIETEYKRRSTLTPTNATNTLEVPRRVRSRSTRDFSKIQLLVDTTKSTTRSSNSMDERDEQ